MTKQKGFSAVEGLLIVFVIGVISFGGWYVWSRQDDEQNNDAVDSISSYEECAAAGYPILESYPEQCSVSNGPTFTRELTEEEQTIPEATDESVENSIPEGWVEREIGMLPFKFATPSGWEGKTGDNASTVLISEWNDPQKFTGYIIGYSATTDDLVVVSTSDTGLNREEAEEDLKEFHKPIESNLKTPVFSTGFSDAEFCSTRLIFRVNDTELGIINLGGSSPTEDGDISCDELSVYKLEIVSTIRLRNP